MKVIAQSAALQEGLALASSIVAVRTPKPVLQCVKLVARDKTLSLVATDLEAGCRFVVEGRLYGPPRMHLAAADVAA